MALEDRIVARFPLLRANAKAVYAGCACLRWLVVFAIWAATAFHYKVFMDLTPAGFVISCVFTAASILVVLGLWTRVSMLALAAALLAHGFLFRDIISCLSAALAFASALLPLGACYSVDRYLAMGRLPPEPFLPGTSAAPAPVALWKKALVAAAVAVILGGPLVNQVLHFQNRYIRSWDMFHLNAKNFVSVRFFLVSGGKREPVDYMAVLGHHLKRREVQQNRPVLDDIRIVGKDQLDRVIGEVCAKVDRPADLRVRARIVHIKKGWHVLYKGDEAVCAAPAGGA